MLENLVNLMTGRLFIKKLYSENVYIVTIHLWCFLQPACLSLISPQAKGKIPLYVLSEQWCCHHNSAYWNAEPARPLKCHGSDTETDELAICQEGQLLLPPPILNPPGKPLETSSPATKDKGLKGSWFLITALLSSEYHNNRLSHWN